MTSKELKEGAGNLVEIIDSYTVVGKEMLKNCSELKGDAEGNLLYQTHTLMFLLERITYNSLTIKLILEEYIRTGNEHYEYSAGLLLRNSCSDIITVLYFNNLGADMKLSTEELEERVKCFLAEEIIKAVNFFKEDNRYLEFKRNMAIEYNTLVELNDKEELINKHPRVKGISFSTTGMIENISKYLIHFKHLDVLWKGYSQYEHLGGLTYHLLRQPFQKKIHDMSHSLYNIILVMQFLSKNLSGQDFDGDGYYKKVQDCMNLYAKYFPLKEIKTN